MRSRPTAAAMARASLRAAASGRGATRRAAAQVDVVAAEPALGDQRGDLRGMQCGAMLAAASTTMRREPRRQRQPPQVSPFVGDAAVAVDGAEFGEERLCLGERGPRRRIEKRELFRACRPTPRGRARKTTGRRPEFPAGRTVRARRSAARPRAGSRRRARCGRRGRGADRPPRATPARFRAGSRRHRARSAAPAPARSRRRCARPRW